DRFIASMADVSLARRISIVEAHDVRRELGIQTKRGDVRGGAGAQLGKVDHGDQLIGAMFRAPALIKAILQRRSETGVPVDGDTVRSRSADNGDASLDRRFVDRQRPAKSTRVDAANFFDILVRTNAGDDDGQAEEDDTFT